MKKFRKDEKAYTQMVPIVLAVIIAFALIFIGSFVAGTIHDELTGSLGSADTDTRTVRTMYNISKNMDSTLDIVQVVIIITVLAAAIGAIFLFTRFGG